MRSTLLLILAGLLSLMLVKLLWVGVDPQPLELPLSDSVAAPDSPLRDRRQGESTPRVEVENEAPLLAVAEVTKTSAEAAEAPQEVAKADSIPPQDDFEEIYRGQSRSELWASMVSIQSSVPLEQVLRPHKVKLEEGDYELLGFASKDEDGSLTASFPNHLIKDNLPFLTRTHILPDGGMARTTVDSSEILGFEKAVREAVWLHRKLRER